MLFGRNLKIDVNLQGCLIRMGRRFLKEMWLNFVIGMTVIPMNVEHGK